MTEDDSNNHEERAPGGLLGALKLVVSTLADAEREGKTTFSRTGRNPGRHFTTEYGFSGQIGGPRRGGESDADDRPSKSRGSARSDSKSSRERENSYLVDIRETEDGLLVIADMPGVEPEEITAGVDEDQNEIVVGVGSRAVERLELPWRVSDVQAQFQHDVLELRFTRQEDTPEGDSKEERTQKEVDGSEGESLEEETQDDGAQNADTQEKDPASDDRPEDGTQEEDT